MKNELEIKLGQEFPFMERTETIAEQKARTGRICNLYQAFGCECSNGWYELLRGLCGEITVAYAEADKPVDIVVDQVKEKFGTLRFYYHFAGEEPGIQAVDFLGTSTLRMYPKVSPLQEKIGEIVSRWEKRSAEVCERCGKPGTLHQVHYRVQTLCDICAEAFERG